jgi:hypothetical protein
MVCLSLVPHLFYPHSPISHFHRPAWRSHIEEKREDKKERDMTRKIRRLTRRWRNTIKAISELAPESSATQHTSYLVEEPIYLVWILSNCIVLIVEIFILHLVVNMLLLMVSPWSTLSFI